MRICVRLGLALYPTRLESTRLKSAREQRSPRTGHSDIQTSRHSASEPDTHTNTHTQTHRQTNKQTAKRLKSGSQRSRRIAELQNASLLGPNYRGSAQIGSALRASLMACNCCCCCCCCYDEFVLLPLDSGGKTKLKLILCASVYLCICLRLEMLSMAERVGCKARKACKACKTPKACTNSQASGIMIGVNQSDARISLAVRPLERPHPGFRGSGEPEM